MVKFISLITYYMIKVIVLASLLIQLAFLKSCPLLPNYQSTTFTGEKELEAIDDQFESDLTYKQSFLAHLKQIPKIALSINGYSSKTTNRVQIYLTAEDIKTDGFSIRAKSSFQTRWVTIKIRFLVTTRKDLYFEVTSASTPTTDSNGFFSLSYLPKQLNIYLVKVRSFINGVELMGRTGESFGIKTIRIQIISDKYVFWYQAINSNIFYFSLSLIIYDPSTPGVTYLYGNVNEKDFKDQYEYSLQNNGLQDLESHLFGFQSFQFRSNQEINIQLDLDPYFALKILSNKFKSFSADYFVLQHLECGWCTNYPYYYNGICQNSCPSGTQTYNGACLPISCGSNYVKNGDGICIPKCSSNQYFLKQSCICVSGYYKINNKCELCSKYNYLTKQCELNCGKKGFYNPINKSCSCNSGEFFSQGECQSCKIGTIFNVQTQSCVNKCSVYEQYTSNGCQCKRGYNKIRGICTICTGGSVYNQVFGDCLCSSGYIWNNAKTQCIKEISCKQNQIYANGQCKCKQGLIKYKEQCTPCPKNSGYNSKTGFCVCNVGFKVSGNQCILVCQNNAQIYQNGSCQCADSYERNSFGDCVKIITCGYYETKINGKCQCIQKYYRNNNGCQPEIQCGQYQTKKYNQCVCIPNYQKNSNRVCVPIILNCPQYQQFINYKCQCVKGYYRNDFGSCVYRVITCPDNQILNAGKCECVPGYARNPDNRCYKITCLYGQEYNYQAKRCMKRCENGTIWSNSFISCVPQCSNGYAWNGIKCICVDQCNIQCLQGYVWNSSLGKCIPKIQCYLPNQIWNGQSCVCIQGYQFIGNGCAPPFCGENQIWVNGKCQCQQNYNMVYGKCLPIQCSPSQYWDANLKRCILRCPNLGQNWNGYACSCQTGYRTNQLGNCVQICPVNYRSVNGKCILDCPPGQIIVQQHCQIQCGANQIWNGNQCICSQGYIYNNQGICIISCPNGYIYLNGRCQGNCQINQIWNGSKCICKPGFISQQTQTSQILCHVPCSQNQQWINGKCQCIKGFTKDYRSICVSITCDGNSKYDPNSGKCLSVCPAPNTWNGVICYCANGYQKNPNGFCVQKCKPGYYRGPEGYCQFGCSNTEVLINGVCKCVIGYSKVNGLCQKCPVDAYQFNGICYCYSNSSPMAGNSCQTQKKCYQNMIYNYGTKRCECLDNYIWVYGKCRIPKQCQLHAYWNGQNCICQYGYFQKYGVCEDLKQHYQCPKNSYFNGVNCQCKDGFYSINGNCIACAPGTYWNGWTCGGYQQCQTGYKWNQQTQCCIYENFKCSNEEYWNGATCICKKQYYWTQKSCSKCPNGSYFDGIQCVLGQPPKFCPDPYSYWNGNRCVCMSNFWQIDNYCVTCPQFTTWNGLYCKSISGLTRSVNSEVSRNTIQVQFIKT